MRKAPSWSRISATTGAATNWPGPIPRQGVAALPLVGWTVAGNPSSSAENVVLRHLAELGARVGLADGGLQASHGDRMVAINVDWAGMDEPTAQAAYGLMAVHGRAQGSGPQRLGVDYVSAVAGVIATLGTLAAVLAGLRGRPVMKVDTSVASAALLTVAQYLASGTADDPEYEAPAAKEGLPPPFASRDGIRFELETLDPQPWADLWTALGIAPSIVGRAWKEFVLRYATATASMPAALHAATQGLTYEELARLAAKAKLAIQPVRSYAERLADPGNSPGRFSPPWTVSPLAGPPSVPVRAMSTDAPLSGLLVVEAGRRIQGPLAGHMLGLLGADVIRIEPTGGDPLRGMPPMIGDCSARFLALNRGKRVVEVDLRTAAGRAKVREVVRSADVFVHNWAPGKAADIGLDADDLIADSPGLVYAHASGWGDERGTNPPPGTDFVAQAYSGLAENLRPAGHPPAGSLMTLLDVLGGLVAAEGIVAALIGRYRTGLGQKVHSSLLSAAGVLQTTTAITRPTWDAWDIPVRTADGHVMVGAGSVPTTSPEQLASLATVSAVGCLAATGLRVTAVCPDPAELITDDGLAHHFEFGGCAFVRPPWRFAT